MSVRTRAIVYLSLAFPSCLLAMALSVLVSGYFLILLVVCFLAQGVYGLFFLCCAKCGQNIFDGRRSEEGPPILNPFEVPWRCRRCDNPLF